jgi:hypothetical protein
MLARGFGILIGYLLACVAFSVVIVAFVFTPAEIAALPSDAAASRLSMAGQHVLQSAIQVAFIASPLALIAALIAEWRGIREWLYFVAVALLVAVVGFLAQYVSELQGQATTIANNYAMAAFLCGGFVAGTVYWLVAGRTSGGKRAASHEAPVSPSTTTPDPEKA